MRLILIWLVLFLFLTSILTICYSSSILVVHTIGEDDRVVDTTSDEQGEDSENGMIVRVIDGKAGEGALGDDMVCNRGNRGTVEGEEQGEVEERVKEMSIAYEYQTDRGIIWDSVFIEKLGTIAYISGNGTIRFIDNLARSVSITGPANNWMEWNVTLSENALVRIVSIPGSEKIVWCDSKGTVGIYDIVSNSSIKANPHHAKITSISISPDMRYIATGSMDSTIVILGTTDLTIMEQLTGSGSVIMDVAFSNDRQYLAAGGLGDEIIVYQTSNWSIHSRITIPEGKWMASLEFVSVGSQQILIFSDSTGGLTFHIPGVEGSIGSHNLTSWANDLHFLDNIYFKIDKNTSIDAITDGNTIDDNDVDRDIENRLVCTGQDGNITVLMIDYSVDGLDITHHHLYGIDSPVYTVSQVGNGICFLTGDGDGRLILWSESSISDTKEGFPDTPTQDNLAGDREIPFILMFFITIMVPVLIMALYLKNIVERTSNPYSVLYPGKMGPVQTLPPSYPPTSQIPYRNPPSYSTPPTKREMIPTLGPQSTIEPYLKPENNPVLIQHDHHNESGNGSTLLPDERRTLDHHSDPRVINIIIRDSVINRSNITVDKK